MVNKKSYHWIVLLIVGTPFFLVAGFAAGTDIFIHIAGDDGQRFATRGYVVAGFAGALLFAAMPWLATWWLREERFG